MMYFASFAFMLFAITLATSLSPHSKTLLRFAVYYDTTNTAIAELVGSTLKSYTEVYGMDDRFAFEVLKFNKELTPDFAEILASKSFTAVVVASRDLPCASLAPYFQLVPFFYVTGSSQNCDQDLDHNRIHYLMPSDSSLMASFFEAVKQYEWKSAAVLYDKNDEVQFTFQNIQDAGSRGLDVVAFEAQQSDESIRSKLIQARRKGIRTYVLVSSYTRLIRIMSVARQLSLSTENYHWFIPNVLLNPQVLHNFLDDGVRITFLHSPLVTPLTLEIITAYPELENDGNKLYQTVVQSLVRIVARGMVEACEKFRLDPKFSESCQNSVRYHHQEILLCGVNINKGFIINTTNVDTTQPYTETVTSGGHGHVMTTTTTAAPSGHGHATTTTATATPSGHGHATTTTTTAAPSGHGHAMTTTTVSGAHSLHRRSVTTTIGALHGHAMSTTTAAPSGHGHAMATTTAAPSGHGHVMTTTTTAAPSGHGHVMTTTTAAPSGHGHAMATTTAAPSGHGHAMTTTTTAAPSGHGHVMTTTTAAPSGHGHAMATTTTTAAPSGHGHAMATTTTAAPSGHGHAMTTTTTAAPSGHGHAMTTTTTVAPSGHGHVMTTTTKAAHGHVMDSAPSSDSHGGHDVSSGVDKEFENCLIKEVASGDVIPPSSESSSSPAVPSHAGHRRRRQASNHHQHSSKFEITTRFDPCPFASTYTWNYNHSTCEATLIGMLNFNDSNPIYTIEHVHAQVDGQNVHQLLNVGGRNGIRSYINVTYEQFAVERVKLPSRDLVIGAVWNPPWLSWEMEDGLPVPGTYEGFLYDVIKALSETMKFNFTMSFETASTFGPGMNLSESDLEFQMNEIFESGMCDIFLYDKIIHGGRILLSDIVSITTPIQTPKMYLLTKRVEKNQEVSIWQFLAPFKEESWVVLWTTLVLVALMMTYINKKNPYEFRRASRDLRPGAKHSEHLGFLNSLWFNFAALVEQSSQLLPRSASLKVLSGTWWLFVMLVIAAYTANMISFMTQVDSQGITTLDELASQQVVKYGLLADNPMLTKILPTAKDHPYSTTWHYVRGRESESLFENIEDAMKRISENNFMLISTFKTVVQALAASCDNDQVGDGFYRYQVGLPVRKGLIFLPAINDNISHLRDVGKLFDFEQKWFGDLETACETSTSMISLDDGGQLDIKAFIGMYVFLGLGLSVGFFFLFLETTYIKFGGIGGFTGRARRYSFRKNQREFLKPETVMSEEFQEWPGGWEVLKHKPFLEEQHESHVKFSKSYSLRAVGTTATRKKDVICCPGCGQESETLPVAVTNRLKSRRSTLATITNTIDDTISIETGYRSGATSVVSKSPIPEKK